MLGKIKELFGKNNLPSDVLFLDQNGNYVTKDGVRCSKRVDELIAEIREELKKGSTILDNVEDL